MAEAAENRERTQRKLAHQARLPTSARGSASHWRHSDVLDWDVPPAGGGSRGDPSEVGLTGGRQHKESRRQALVFERLRESVRQIQEGRNSAGPVRVRLLVFWGGFYCCALSWLADRVACWGRRNTPSEKRTEH